MPDIPAIISNMSKVAKAKLEKEKAQVLKVLPDEIKGFFGSIGFVANDEGSVMQPILIVSPYDVPPKPVRDIYWMDAFSKAKGSKARLKELDHLVYLYGSDDPDDCYIFIEQEDFVSLEEGMESGLDILPEHIASKAPEERTETEQKLVRALEEMKADIPKAPEDRKHGNPFLERYEILLSKEKGGDDSSSQPKTKKQKT